MTNNAYAVDTHGDMSHVWLGIPVRSSREDEGWLLFDGTYQRVLNLTHWMLLQKGVEESETNTVMSDCEYEAWMKDWLGKHVFYEQQMEIPAYALGLCGEVGEVVDHIKKSLRRTDTPVGWASSVDQDELIEELGDVEWYLAALRIRLSIPRDLVLRRNVDKLETRARAEGITKKK